MKKGKLLHEKHYSKKLNRRILMNVYTFIRDYLTDEPLDRLCLSFTFIQINHFIGQSITKIILDNKVNLINTLSVLK